MAKKVRDKMDEVIEAVNAKEAAEDEVGKQPVQICSGSDHKWRAGQLPGGVRIRTCDICGLWEKTDVA